MKINQKHDRFPEELTLAIGLVWGHLHAHQFESADQLARGCLRVWPGQQQLVLMAAYASVELAKPLDTKILAVLNSAECKDWVKVVLRRAENNGGIVLKIPQ